MLKGGNKEGGGVGLNRALTTFTICLKKNTICIPFISPVLWIIMIGHGLEIKDVYSICLHIFLCNQYE